ncbi:MAG: ATPase, T2SS/T4P/T4SS family [Candidatus Wallbacteria bacterium]
MNKKILSDFFMHFSQLLSSGKPLLDALIVCRKKSYMKNYQSFMDYIIEKIKTGNSLTRIFLNINFPEEYMEYFSAGERDGMLDRTMAELSASLSSSDSDSQEIIINLPKNNIKSSSNEGLLTEKNEYNEAVNLVNKWIKQCISEQASDLHVIPVKGGEAVIKHRINGLLHEKGRIGKEELNKGIARIKFMACLDVAEKRMPQDGRILIKIDGSEVDLRVSVVPTVVGEKLTIRFFQKNETVIGLDKINLNEIELKTVKEMLKKPYGLIFITGISGSGKTTTCYSVLNDYIEKGCNVVTIEQPAEYLLNGATQIAIDASVGLTCLAALKSAMRTDPDVIFLSEFSDPEIINYAFKAAQTGHIVICQAGYKTIFELIDALLKIKTIDHTALANILNGAIAQILLRRLCDCKKKSDIIPTFLKKSKNNKTCAPVGCDKCLNSGYKGRIPVYDALIFKHNLKEAIASRDIKKIKKLLPDLLEKKAIQLIKDGITSSEEVNRVLGLTI